MKFLASLILLFSLSPANAEIKIEQMNSKSPDAFYYKTWSIDRVKVSEKQVRLSIHASMESETLHTDIIFNNEHYLMGLSLVNSSGKYLSINLNASEGFSFTTSAEKIYLR